MEDIQPTGTLDKILLQITNGGAECEIYLVQGVAKHRVSTGPLAPLLDQLDAVREQYATAVTEIVLEPGAGVETAGQSSGGGWGVFRRSKSMDKKKGRKGKRGSTGGEEMPAWFTRETAEKAFHLLSSLELLELPARLARDLQKVHEKAQVAQPYERASLETSRETFEREFAKAMLVANCAGYKPEDMGPVKSFADEFKGRRLWSACQAFETDCSTALSRLPPEVGKKVAAVPSSWPANAIPVLEAVTFDTKSDAEASAAPQQSTEVSTSKEGGKENAGTVPEPVAKSAAEIGWQHEEGSAKVKPDGASAVGQGEPGKVAHAAAAESDGAPKEEKQAAKAEGAASLDVVKERKASAEVKPTGEETGGPLLTRAAAVVTSALSSILPAVANPVEKFSAGAAEKSATLNGPVPEVHSAASAMPSKDASVKPTSKAVNKEARSSNLEPPEAGEVPAHAGVTDEAPTFDGIKVDEPELEPSKSASSPVLRGKQGGAASPLSWSDEEQMKLARDSYGSQGLAGIGVAPVLGGSVAGAFESGDLPLGAMEGSLPAEGPSAHEGLSEGVKAGKEAGEKHLGNAARTETANEEGGLKLTHDKKSSEIGVGGGAKGEAVKGSAAKQVGGAVTATEREVTPAKGGDTTAAVGIDELWRATKERLFSLAPQGEKSKSRVSEKGDAQEVSSDIAEAGSSEHSRQGGALEAPPGSGVAREEPETASDVSVAGSSRGSGKGAGDSTVQAGGGSESTEKGVVPAVAGGVLAAVGGVASAIALAVTGRPSPSSVEVDAPQSEKHAQAAPAAAAQADDIDRREGPRAPTASSTRSGLSAEIPSKESPETLDQEFEHGGPLPLSEGPEGPDKTGEASSVETKLNPTLSNAPSIVNHSPAQQDPDPDSEQHSTPKADDEQDESKESVAEHPAETHPAPSPSASAPVASVKARSYDKPWLSHVALPANEGAPAGKAHVSGRADGGAKDGERRASEGRARRDSMASYKERRQAKMKEQEDKIRGEHEAKLKALEDALEKRKAEMAERSRRSALLSATAADRRAALEGSAAAAATPEDATDEAKERARERLRKYREDKGLASAEASPPVGSRVNQLLAKLGVMVGNSPTEQSQGEPATAQSASAVNEPADGKKSLAEKAPASSRERRSPSQPKTRPQGPSPGAKIASATPRSQSATRRRSASGPPEGAGAIGKASGSRFGVTDVLERSISPGRGSIVRSPQAPSRGPSPARTALSTLAPGQASPGRASLANTPKSASSPYPSPRGPLSGRASPKAGGWNKLANTPPSKSTPAIAQTTPRGGDRSNSGPLRGGNQSQRKAPPQAGTFGRSPRSSGPGTFGAGPQPNSAGTFGAAPRLNAPGTFGRPNSAGKAGPAASKFARPTSASAVERRVEELSEEAKGPNLRAATKGPGSRGIFQPKGSPASAASKQGTQDAAKPAWSSGLRVTVPESTARARDRFGNRTALPPTPQQSKPWRSASAAAGPRRTSVPGNPRSASTGGVTGNATPDFKRAFGPGGTKTATSGSQPEGRPKRGRHSIAAIPAAPSPAKTPRRSSGGFGASTSVRDPLKLPADAANAGSVPKTSSFLLSAKDRLLSQTKASQAKLAEKAGPTILDTGSKRRERRSVAGVGLGATNESSTRVVRPARRASAGEAYHVDTDVDNASVETVRSPGSIAALSVAAVPLVQEEAPGKSTYHAEGKRASEEEAGRLKGWAVERADSVERMFGEEIVLEGETDKRKATEADALQQKLLALLQARQQSSLADDRATIQVQGARENQKEWNGNVQGGGFLELGSINTRAGERMLGTGANEDSALIQEAVTPTKMRKRWDDSVEPLVMQSPGDNGGALGKLGKLFSRKTSKGGEGGASPLR